MHRQELSPLDLIKQMHIYQQRLRRNDYRVTV